MPFSQKNNSAAGEASTMDLLLDEWLDQNRSSVTESTYAKYYNLIERHIRPSLGQFEISKLSTQQLSDYVRQKLLTGRLDQSSGLSKKTVQDLLSVIRSVLKYAESKEYTVSCDIDQISVEKEPVQLRILTKAEQVLLESSLWREPDSSKVGVLLSLYTGIRIGELCALRWNNIDLTNATLRVRHTLQRIQNIDAKGGRKTKIIIARPNSACTLRDIPLPTFLCKILKDYVPHTSGAYFLTGRIDKFIEPRTYQNRFKEYVVQAGIQSVPFSALRDTFAMRCLESGFDLQTLSEILGHANASVTAARYLHLTYDTKRDQMNKLHPTYTNL